MALWQRIRGLIGTTLTWGVVGALTGVLVFVVRYQPWSWAGVDWGKAARLFGAFLAMGTLWGGACGLAFGLVVLALGRRQRFDQLSAWRFVTWGAIAGAAFPAALYARILLNRGEFAVIPRFAGLVLIGTLLGAGFARLVLSAARRAPLAPGEPATVPALREGQDR